MNYESAIERLSQIVEALSNEKLSLKQSTELFEEGSKLIKYCYEQVKATKGKIMEIKDELNKLKMEDME